MYKTKLIYLLVCSALVVTGCTTKDIQSRNRLDYMKAASANPLELPPDLTKRIDQQDRSVNVLSQYRSQTAKGSGLNVLASSSDIKIERAGEQRWISAKLPADYVWTQSMQLFQELGLTIEYSNPEAGLAETTWAENRADVPDSFIRRLLKSTMDQLFSSPTRDKFKFRIERGGANTVLVYITHYGMKDQTSGRDSEFHTWVDRPRDPELEAEFLSQLVVKLGGDKTREVVQKHGVVVASQTGNGLVVNRPFNSIWVQVGTVLDDGAEYRVEEQMNESNSYRILRSKKAKRGLKFWKKKEAYDEFIVQVFQESNNTTRIEVRALGDTTYQQALIDKLKINLL